MTSFDRLPKRKELIFQRERKVLYLQLTTVIRSLATKFTDRFEAGQIFKFSGRLSSTDQTYRKPTVPRRIFCILYEIHDAVCCYEQFIKGESGYVVHTQKLRTAIARLEFLRDNWNDLIVDGDLKHGYELVLKPTKS